MFALTSQYCYYLYRQPTDMRKSFNGLGGLIHTQFRRSPSTGEVFLFVNKSRNMIKLLRWEDSGFVLYCKRLERGTLELPAFDQHATSCVMSWAQLVMMVEGISMKRVHQRKRYSIFGRNEQKSNVGVNK